VKRLLLVLSAILAVVPLHAQTSDRVEAFAGYSYTRYTVFQLYNGPWTPYNFNGGLGSVAFRLSPHLGLEGEVGGGYASSIYGQSYSMLTFMGGPRISHDSGRLGLYGHALFGALRFTPSYTNYNISKTSFAAALGGGAEIWFSRRIGMRLAQVDLLLNTNTAAALNGLGGNGPISHLRIATGITARF
jgi:hypothetical protein